MQLQNVYKQYVGGLSTWDMSVLLIVELLNIRRVKFSLSHYNDYMDVEFYFIRL